MKKNLKLPVSMITGICLTDGCILMVLRISSPLMQICL